ncbi:MAG: malate dehydrogenase (quinone) [Oleiphilaceae bacterium]|nr:malate dehydrogenase (quinone) [Oleiphilaceae bacterium]
MIGGGIMSATLATLVSELDNTRSMTLIEQAERFGNESSDAWNNAGTGHAGYCELNYTPQSNDGSVAPDRALAINEQFETSLQFWSSLTQKGVFARSEDFIKQVPHLSWVKGEQASRFLAERHRSLSKNALFDGMEYSNDPSELNQWLPLITAGRSSNESMAATRVQHGSDVNFGALTRMSAVHLSSLDNVDVRVSSRVVNLDKQGDRWHVTVQNVKSGERTVFNSGFVFIGAGGASLSLLQKSGVKEAKGYGGFPVSGIWLACQNEELALSHNAKVYSQAEVGAPPMSVPHLDTRYIDGKPALLFGPFAGFTTKFLKQGNILDLIRSVRLDNIVNLLQVARNNWSLTQYLVEEALSSRNARLTHLNGFLPQADHSEWQLRRAGQRVQIIKTGAQGKGSLEFGTEVLATKDRSLAALMGASPGASTCVSAMLDVIERCMPELTQGSHLVTLQSLIPSYGHSLKNDAQLLANVRAFTHSTLGLSDSVSTVPSFLESNPHMESTLC